MRRLLCVWVIIALTILPCTSWAEDESSQLEALDDFGMHMTYKTDASVILRSGTTPYYSNVKNYTCQDVYLAGRAKSGYSGRLPYGTLTAVKGNDSSAGTHYPLRPSDYGIDSSNPNRIVSYILPDGRTINDFTGQRVMWNVYTSPDVKVGAATVKSSGDISEAVSGIAPYIELVSTDENNPYNIQQVKLHFVTFGSTESLDLTSADIPRVVFIYYHKENDGSVQQWNNEMYNDFSGEATFYVGGSGTPVSELSSIVIEYDYGINTYIWTFEYRGPDSTADLGVLDETVPLEMTEGTSMEVTIKLPVTANVSVDEEGYPNNVGIWAVNGNVAYVDEIISCDIGSFSWNDDLTCNETKTTITFNILAAGSGRTVLRIDTPSFNARREIWVLDESGDITLSQDESPDLRPQVSLHETIARYAGRTPYYPSAQFNNIEFNLVGSDDAFTFTYEENGETISGDVFGGTFGLTDGTNTFLFDMWRNESNDKLFVVEPYGISEDLSRYTVWWEIGNGKTDFNLVSGSLKAVLSGDNDFMTTEEQLETAAPYFELIPENGSNGWGSIASIEWKFINPSTGADVTEGISDVSIMDFTGELVSYTGTSGTITLSEAQWFGAQIVFEYTYNGMRYRWIFDSMERNENYASLPYMNIPVGSSADFTVSASNSEAESFTIRIWSEDIVSVEPISSDSVSNFTFTVTGLKESYNDESHLFLITKRSGYSSHDSYVCVENYMSVYSEDKGNRNINDTLVSADLNAPFFLKSEGSIVGGKSQYFGSDSKAMTLSLERPDLIPLDVFYAYSADLNGTLYIYTASGDDEIALGSQDLVPEINYTNTYMGKEYVNVSYGEVTCDEGATHVSWVFPDEINTSGDAYVNTENILSINEQLAGYKPYVKLNMNGLNVSDIECCFVDSNDASADWPDGLNGIYVNVEMQETNNVAMGIGEESKDLYPLTLSVNQPEMYINKIFVDFNSGDVDYRWNFYPIDSTASYWDEDTSSNNVFTWDIDSPDYPLVMTVGDTRTVTLTAANISDPSAVIADTSVASLDTVSSSDKTVKVTIQANKAGMTTLSVMSVSTSAQTTFPREIWVSDESGDVPGLTSDVTSFLSELKSGDTTSTSGSDDSGSDDSGGGSSSGGGTSSGDIPVPPTRDEILEGAEEIIVPANIDGKEISAKDTAVEGLSVYPKFAMPRDPSEDAYKSMQEFYTEGEVLMFSKNPSYIKILNDFTFNTVSGDAEGTYNVVVTGISFDVAAVFRKLSADLLDMDTPQILALVLPDIEVKHAGMYMFRLSVSNITRPGTAIFWHSLKEDNVPANVSAVPMSDDAASKLLKDEKYLFMTDEGYPANVISGDEFINVAVYLEEGKFTPVVTAEASEKDIDTMNDAIENNKPIPVPVSPDISPDIPDPTPAPVSPDIPDPAPAPVSPDVSPDRPAPTPTPSRDITPVPTPTPSRDVTPTPTPSRDVTPTPTPSRDVTPTPTPSQDVTPTPTPTPEPSANRSVMPETTQLNLTGVSSSILTMLGMPSGTVRTLPSSAYGGERGVDDLSSEDLSAVPSTQTIAAVLPIIVVNEPAVYVFAVTLDNLSAGANIFLHMMSESALSSAVSASASDSEDSYIFLDDNGNEVTTVPSNKHVNIAAYLTPEKIYAPVITTGTSTPSQTSTRVGSSGGGCNSGFSVYVLVLAGLSLALRRKK